MAQDNTVKPYTLDDLAEAMGRYQVARAAKEAAVKVVEAKRSEMESFQLTADRAEQDVQRHRATVRKILNNLER